MIKKAAVTILRYQQGGGKVVVFFTLTVFLLNFRGEHPTECVRSWIVVCDDSIGSLYRATTVWSSHVGALKR